jgi:purine-binding chemotaxis protein CheW
MVKGESIDLDDDDMNNCDDAQKDKYITFRLGNEDYAIEIRYVREIIGMQKITRLPAMPDFIMGVVNLRGNVIPIIDIRRRFNMESALHDERTCIIVARLGDNTVGLVVDEVSEVMDIPPSCIDPPPVLSHCAHNRFIQGIGKTGEQVKIILGIDKILNSEEIEDVSKFA